MSDVTEKGQPDHKATTSGAEQVDQTDNDFEPSADQLVHDFDDEQTMEEEENLSAESEGEIDNLLKEGDMPIEELLAMYGRSHDNYNAAHQNEDGGFNSQDNTQDVSDMMEDDLEDDVYNGSEEEDDDNDDDYTPALDEYWKKDYNRDFDFDPSNQDIRIGDEYQVEIPDAALPLEPYQLPNESHAAVLLWDPEGTESDKVELYLRTVKNPSDPVVMEKQAMAVIPDEEQALYNLMQSRYNTEAALTKSGEVDKLPQDPPMSWTEEECQNFEAGLRMYGKNFFAIQQNKVKNRSVGELVKFYYFWKKTERREAFADLGKLEKRKFNLNPGTTDYVDRYGDQANFDELNPAALEQSCNCNSTTAKPVPDEPVEAEDSGIPNHTQALSSHETAKQTSLNE